ncbi:alanine and glycine-rich protein-like [Panicum virgatum]|uniref:alanine and glycine-rich protein-like n=1 Tax=Panicum virgatum TaxID=38727 RepID=UPI0019D62047|nr:alanine and glycine-rich protein-like [Panicum virgatum]
MLKPPCAPPTAAGWAARRWRSQEGGERRSSAPFLLLAHGSSPAPSGVRPRSPGSAVGGLDRGPSRAARAELGSAASGARSRSPAGAAGGLGRGSFPCSSFPPRLLCHPARPHGSSRGGVAEACARLLGGGPYAGGAGGCSELAWWGTGHGGGFGLFEDEHHRWFACTPPRTTPAAVGKEEEGRGGPPRTTEPP